MNFDDDVVLDDRSGEQLRQLGTVEPVRAEVLDASLSRLRVAIGEEEKSPTSSEGLVSRKLRRRWGLAIMSATGVAAAAALLITAPWATQTQMPAHVATGDGQLPGAATASCAQEYSLDELGQRSFGFDGTVSKIHTWGKTRVTFRVNQWYRGGSGAEVTVTLPAPIDTALGQRASSDEQLTSPSYTVGTRLLVSGSFADGTRDVSDAYVFGCGFTRYFDETTARQWASELGS